MTRPWSPESWRELPAAQQPDWGDPGALDLALKELRNQPPLVFAGEARALKAALGAASRGEAFVLQAGECAESFDNLSADSIRDQLKIILQMAVVLTYGAGVPVVKVGRIAGQFAKPRSAPTEQIGDMVLPVFRGHIVNDDAPTPEGLADDPFARIFPRTLLRVDAGFVGMMPTPAGPGVQRYAGAPWPWDHF